MTSIEWLEDWMTKNQYFIGNDLLVAIKQAKEMHKQEIAQLSQQEISDEEIEKAARDYDNSVIYGPPLLHFEQGAFWYREQLKHKL